MIQSARVGDVELLDIGYVDRIIRMNSCFSFPMRNVLLALDKPYDETGKVFSLIGLGFFSFSHYSVF